MTTKQIWACKIGINEQVGFTCKAADLPMRQAIESAFLAVTGHEPDFIFSGWSAELTEGELAVLENRLPVPEIDWKAIAEKAEAKMEMSVTVGGGMLVHGSYEAIKRVQAYILIDSPHPAEAEGNRRYFARALQKAEAALAAANAQLEAMAIDLEAARVKLVSLSFDKIQTPDLNGIEEFLLHKAPTRGAFFPIDAQHLSNISLHVLREIRALRSQKPVGRTVIYDSPTNDVEWFGEIPKHGTNLYAQPVPAAPAQVPDALRQWHEAYGRYLSELQEYNRKVNLGRELGFPGVDVDKEYQAFTKAQNEAYRLHGDVFEAIGAMLQSQPKTPCVHPPGCTHCSWCGFKSDGLVATTDAPACSRCGQAKGSPYERIGCSYRSDGLVDALLSGGAK